MKRTLAILLLFGIVSTGEIAKAQEQAKVARIGVLVAARPAATASRAESFRQALRELGYSEGKNIVIEWRYAEGKRDRLPGLAAELVSLNTDVIVTTGASSTRAAQKATPTIPIVMAQNTDPVGSGFVASLARPGGNITGLSALSVEVGGKRLELLKEMIPSLSRVAVFVSSNSPSYGESVNEMKLAAKALGVQLEYLDVLTPDDIEVAFRRTVDGRAEAILPLVSFVLNFNRKKVAELAIKSRLPGIYYNDEWVKDGGLMSYGVSFTDLFRRAATYVDKILKGANPAELPVEQPTKFDLTINLKTAKQIGLTIPAHVLARADTVIK